MLAGDSARLASIVAARASGGRTDRGGIGLFLVDAKANGVTRRGYPTQDCMRAADVTLSAVRVGPEAVLAGPDKGLAVLERVVDEAIAALSAEAVGGMAALHELTVDYLKTRKQFGVPIGSFQVLQHRSVDMFTALEQARSMAFITPADGQASKPTLASGAKPSRRLQQIGRSARTGRRDRHPAARRHRHDHGVQGRPLLQAPDHDRHGLRRRRPPPALRWHGPAAWS